MKAYPLLLILFFLGCSNEIHVKRLDKTSISIPTLDQKIQALVEAAEVRGLAISIFNDNRVVYAKTFENEIVEESEALTAQSVFSGASYSKAVFAYLVTQLVNEGKLDLDTPLQSYLAAPLPEIKFEKEWRGFNALAGDKRYEQLTARMCLAHTTGFPNWRWMTHENDFFREGKIRFLIDPGTRYSYSGEGINLLQYVVEQITGEGLERMAQERIFRPLKMDRTSYVWQESLAKSYCHGHSAEGKTFPLDPEDEANAAGSLSTTLEDYSKFIRHILTQASETSPETELLFTPNIRIKSQTQFGYTAWEDTDENDDIALSYGLGWGILSSPHGYGAFKEGHGEGFQHYSIIFPQEKIGVVLLSNSDNAESIFKEVLELSIADVYTPWKWERYIPYNLER